MAKTTGKATKATASKESSAATPAKPASKTATKKHSLPDTPTPDEERPSKRRKAADAASAKLKEIAEAEEYVSEDEVIHPKTKAKVIASKEAEDDDDTDVEDLDCHLIEAPPVVAPGFRVWETKSKLASRGELSQWSKYNESQDDYSHFLKIHNDEAFTLMPLIVTQGPYKGRRVFMLEPTTGFRFMEFPAEIRNLVYSCLLEYEQPLKMTTAKKVNEPRRPVFARYDRKPPPATPLTILRSSKQVHREAAPIMYGNNHFHFHDLTDMKVFLDRIGSTRPYVRHIHIDGFYYPRSKANSNFASLKEATGLRTLSFRHENICKNDVPRWYCQATPFMLTAHMARTLRALHKAHEKSQSGFSVLDLVKVVWHRCDKCKLLEPNFPEDDKECNNAPRTVTFNVPAWNSHGRCDVVCKDAAKHCEEVEKDIRDRIAKQLGIEE